MVNQNSQTSHVTEICSFQYRYLWIMYVFDDKHPYLDSVTVYGPLLVFSFKKGDLASAYIKGSKVAF